MTITEEIREMEEKWLPIFRERYGNDATIEELECVKSGVNGMTYRVLVRSSEGENGEHYVRVLLGSSDPMTIDGMLTPAGQNYVDFWAEYGKVMGDAYK